MPARAINKVAIFGASGNFGTPITAALVREGFHVTIITRVESSSTFPPGIPVVRTNYSVQDLASALEGQDAVVCAVGPAGLLTQVAMIDAAEKVGVKRFIIDEFGWGPDFKSMPEFDEIKKRRRIAWDHAKDRALANPCFTYTGITIENPIDWAIERFPLMGFDVQQRVAIIYDEGKEDFAGTTLAGIGQAVVGVLIHPDETANRFVKARSIQVCENNLLQAFQCATNKTWDVQHATARQMLERGQQKYQSGRGGWILDLVVAQLYLPVAETPEMIAEKVLESIRRSS